MTTSQINILHNIHKETTTIPKEAQTINKYKEETQEPKKIITPNNAVKTTHYEMFNKTYLTKTLHTTFPLQLTHITTPTITNLISPIINKHSKRITIKHEHHPNKHIHIPTYLPSFVKNSTTIGKLMPSPVTKKLSVY